MLGSISSRKSAPAVAPIVPPTREAIDEFLKFTDRAPDEVLGVLLPDRRAATVWNVAVNGVMAGCRPEYMPVLVALVEAMCDPQYGVCQSGQCGCIGGLDACGLRARR